MVLSLRFLYPRSGFGSQGEHPPKPRFWKPPCCEPPLFLRLCVNSLQNDHSKENIEVAVIHKNITCTKTYFANDLLAKLRKRSQKMQFCMCLRSQGAKTSITRTKTCLKIIFCCQVSMLSPRITFHHCIFSFFCICCIVDFNNKFWPNYLRMFGEFCIAPLDQITTCIS